MKERGSRRVSTRTPSYPYSLLWAVYGIVHSPSTVGLIKTSLSSHGPHSWVFTTSLFWVGRGREPSRPAPRLIRELALEFFGEPSPFSRNAASGSVFSLVFLILAAISGKAFQSGPWCGFGVHTAPFLVADGLVVDCWIGFDRVC